MQIIDFKKTIFVMGITKLDEIPNMYLPEIAFIGRSNVGKSSLLNAVVGSDIARVSKTPGRTQQINLFNVDGKCIIADLPGYGYAKVSKKMQQEWKGLIDGYLKRRVNLQRVFLLIDSRHLYKNTDSEILNNMQNSAVSFQTILTKVDKTDSVRVNEVREINEKYTSAYPEVLAVSAHKNIGIKELKSAITKIVYGLSS